MKEKKMCVLKLQTNLAERYPSPLHRNYSFLFLWIFVLVSDWGHKTQKKVAYSLAQLECNNNVIG